MTSPEARPSAAGVFVVRDPDVCAPLEALLQPHHTSPPPAILHTAPSGAAVLADAIAHASELLGKPTETLAECTEIESLLDLTYTEGNVAGQTKAATEGRVWTEQLQERARRAETAAGHAERDLDSTRQQLQDALAELTEVRDTRGATAPAECAERDLAETRRQLEEAKEEIAKLAARPDGRRPTVSAQRLKDQQAFAALAERMDRAALSQSKSVAAALRESAKGVRCEIAILYGNAERKAS